MAISVTQDGASNSSVNCAGRQLKMPSECALAMTYETRGQQSNHRERERERRATKGSLHAGLRGSQEAS